MIICVKSTHTQTQRVKKNTKEGGPEESAPKVFEMENKNKKTNLHTHSTPKCWACNTETIFVKLLRIHGFSLNILSVLFISLTHWVRIKWISAFVYMKKHGICLRHIAATEFLWKNFNSLNNSFVPLLHPFLVSTSSNLLSFRVCTFRVPAHSEQTNKIEIHSVLNPFEYVVDNYMYIHIT